MAPDPPPVAAPVRRRIRSLVMWSGGLDSTYSLVRLLRESGDEVHAHHVHRNARTPDGRRRSRICEYEARAVAALRTALADGYRPFEYTESRVDLAAFPERARDSTVAMFFAAQAAMSARLTPFDRIVLGVNADDDGDWAPGTHACSLRRLIAIRTLKAVWECEEVPYLYLWPERPTRHEEAAFLGAELAALTASCRDPELVERALGEPAFRPCRRCPPCRILGRDAAQPPGGGHAGLSA
jgi:7-cyano-7-deazaguanine synthase in queuosine biosynthesis